MTKTTKYASTSVRPQVWYSGSTGASSSGMRVFEVEAVRGSSVAAEISHDYVDPEIEWTQVLCASEQSSFAFLNDEPDLYED